MRLKPVVVKKPRIAMMPLIDSFFLILVYFIYAFLSMSLHKGIPLNLPYASTSEESKVAHYAVSVDRQGSFFLDKEPVHKDKLKKSLKQRLDQDHDKFQLYIFGDKLAPHGEIVFVLNIARELGIDKVLIETNTDRDEDES